MNKYISRIGKPGTRAASRRPPQKPARERMIVGPAPRPSYREITRAIRETWRLMPDGPGLAFLERDRRPGALREDAFISGAQERLTVEFSSPIRVTRKREKPERWLRFFRETRSQRSWAVCLSCGHVWLMPEGIAGPPHVEADWHCAKCDPRAKR